MTSLNTYALESNTYFKLNFNALNKKLNSTLAYIFVDFSVTIQRGRVANIFIIA